MSRYLHHVTLTTGHSRRSWAHEIDPALMGRIRDLIAAAREPGGAVIPGVQPAGCRLTMLYESAHCCALAVHDPGEALLLTIGVAAHARCGAPLWDRLTYPQTPPLTRPRTPWCAVRIEAGAILYPPPSALLPALADMERCIAWAWLDDPDRR